MAKTKPYPWATSLKQEVSYGIKDHGLRNGTLTTVGLSQCGQTQHGEQCRNQHRTVHEESLWKWQSVALRVARHPRISRRYDSIGRIRYMKA
ncbi:hypothetical protein BN874_400046 [Candidatus Contendobacter odensis Run_B_J11]|uniref:Uncharacterized protein n=1 Tax=Candidatus Contendobacter odensis Run_B_J11 TaxID=1400861 RepID=A0A7U7GD89_9GAMM|nr:hypothetical protein BN874_400046 [Candidatus Contendobacter odensis Run_B_J11]